jgi:hypothetical protein
MQEKKRYISTAEATAGYCEFHFLRKIQREARLLKEYYGKWDNIAAIVIMLL